MTFINSCFTQYIKVLLFTLSLVPTQFVKSQEKPANNLTTEEKEKLNRDLKEIQYEIDSLRKEFNKDLESFRSHLENRWIFNVGKTNRESGLFFFEGDEIRITAEGSVKTGYYSGYTGPSGNLAYRSKLWNVVKDHPYGALLCKVGEDGVYRVVGDSLEFVAQTSGELKLFINDNDLSDNYGHFRSVLSWYSQFSPEDHVIPSEGRLTYLTENQRKELTRIRAERANRVKEERMRIARAKMEAERLQKEKIEAEKRAEEVRQAELSRAREKRHEEHMKIKRENPLLLDETSSEIFLTSSIQYLLTCMHEQNFYTTLHPSKSYSVSPRINETSIVDRKRSSKKTISAYMQRGPIHELNGYLNGLKSAIEYIYVINVYELAETIYGTMNDTNIGFDMPTIKRNLNTEAINKLIIEEKQESKALRYVKMNDPNSNNLLDKKNLWGLKNSLTGEVICRPKFQQLGIYSEGLILAKQNDMIGYLNEKGEVSIPFEFGFGTAFSEGLAAVSKNFKKWGYINTQGEIIVPFKYVEAFQFGIEHRGMAKVKKSKNGNFIYIDTVGNCKKDCN